MTEVVAGHKDQQKEFSCVEALPNKEKIMVRTIDGN